MARRSAPGSVAVETIAASRMGSTEPFSARQKSGWSSCSAGERVMRCSESVCLHGPGTLGLGEHVLDGRDVVVPLDEGRDRAEAPHGITVKAPHPLGNGRVVR